MEKNVMETTSSENPFAKMDEEVKKHEGSVEISILEKEEISEKPNCCYYECCTDQYCDKCNKKCNGMINVKMHKAQTVDQSKMCLKVGDDPEVFYISKEEMKSLLDYNKVAYLEVKLDKSQRIVKDNKIKLFFGIKED